jgi:inner membrane protein
MVAQVTLVVAAVIGSAIVDLDQQDSLAARKVERLGGIPIFVVIVALVLFLHQQTSLIAWVMAILMAFVFGTQRNILRRVGLGVIGAGLLYTGLTNVIPISGAVVLTAWLIGAMFTKHRTFTHSLPGLIVFAIGIITAMQGVELVRWLSHYHVGVIATVAPAGLVVGYILHMAADTPAGGIPLFWPWGKRFGGRLIKTGGGWDHLIGGIALLGFFALAIF